MVVLDERAILLSEEEREWMEAWEYAQTHTPQDALHDGLRAVADALGSGEITSEQADACLRIFIGNYVAVHAAGQITDYLERHFWPWGHHRTRPRSRAALRRS